MLQPPPQRQGDAALGDRGRRLPRALSGGPDWLRSKRLWAGLLAGALLIGGGGVLVTERCSTVGVQQPWRSRRLAARRKAEFPGRDSISYKISMLRTHARSATSLRCTRGPRAYAVPARA